MNHTITRNEVEKESFYSIVTDWRYKDDVIVGVREKLFGHRSLGFVQFVQIHFLSVSEVGLVFAPLGSFGINFGPVTGPSV